MAIKIIKGFALILAAASSTCDFSTTRGDYGYGLVEFAPMIRGYNYSFTAKFKANPPKTDEYFQRIYFNSDIKANATLFYGTIDGSESSNPSKYTLSADWIADKINRLYMIRTKNAERCGLPIRVDFYPINPFSISLPQSDDYVFTEPSNCRSRFVDSALTYPLVTPSYYARSYEFKGFKEDIVCDGGTMSFTSMTMHAYDTYHSLLPITMDSPYILIKNGAEYFSIGEKVAGVHGEICRKIPLKLKQKSDGKTVFALDRKYYLDVVRCTMREATTTKNPGEISTENIFFPYSSEYKPVNYTAEIHGNNFCGLNGCTFSYSFNAINNIKKFGGCLSGQYCVGVS